MDFIPKIRQSTFTKVVLIATIAIGLTSAFSLTDFSYTLELLSLDLRYRLRAEIKKSDDIVLINFDDKSIDHYGSWPWSRSYQVFLLETLRYYKAGPVVYDVLFIEPEPPVVITKDKHRSKSDIHIVDNDKAFARAIRDYQSVYLAYASRDPVAGTKREDIQREVKRLQHQHPEPKTKAVAYLKSQLIKTPEEVKRAVYKSIDLDLPLVEFMTVAKGFGFAQPGYSRDGVIRDFILYRHYDDFLLNPLVMPLFADMKGIDLKAVTIRPAKEVRLGQGDSNEGQSSKTTTIPVDSHLNSLLNWPGRFEDSFTHISFVDLIYCYVYQRAVEATLSAIKRGPPDPETVRDRIINELSPYHLLREKTLNDTVQRAVASVYVAHYLTRGFSGQGTKDSIGGFIDADTFEESLFSVSTAIKADAFLKNNPSDSFEAFVSLLDGSRDRKAKALQLFTDFKKLQGLPEAVGLKRYLIPPRIPAKVNGREVTLSPLDLKDKIVFLGLTAKGTVDLNPTPYEKSCPMVFYHASALNMLLNESFLHYPPYLLRYLTPLVLIILVALVGVYGSTLVLTFSVFVLAPLYTSVSYLFWTRHGQWIEVVLPVFAVFMTYLIVMVVKFYEVYREKSRVRGLFSAMVSPKVLAVMESNPESFSLTGKRTFATTYFSKIEGLEYLTRSMHPQELPIFLSNYLTPMSNIIMHYDGYIDKYEGSVIMADFGVPIEDSDNPIKCAFACIEQVNFIRVFGQALSSIYSTEISVSIGFNSGYVSAGNMGSDQKFQYTVMGDAVNMAARFMAANSIYRSLYPITSEETVSVLKDYVYARPLDKLLLKGKTVPTKIYDIVGWKAEAYLELTRGKPIPDFLHTLWGDAPVDSIEYYQRFWEHQYQRTGHELSTRIAEFFGSQSRHLKDLKFLEFAVDSKKAVEQLYHLLKQIDTNLITQLRGDDLRSFLSRCHETLDSVVQRLHQSENADRLLSMAEVLARRFDLLSERLGKIEQSFDYPKDFILSILSQDLDKAVSQLEAQRARYRKEVRAFISTIKAEQYHRLNSLVGEPENKTLIALYEQGLEQYWHRQWDRAIEVFGQVLTIDGNDRPALQFIQRLQGYKETPPPPNWQGEFIQTKK